MVFRLHIFLFSWETVLKCYLSIYLNFEDFPNDKLDNPTD